MRQWQHLMQDVLTNGESVMDRTGVGTKSLFGVSLSVTNYTIFPAVTTKRLAWNQVKGEMASFLRGYNNVEQFHQMGCTVWDKNAKPDGTLGPIYGAQWRNWGWHDQMAELDKQIRTNPTSRRLLVSAWNVTQLDSMCLPPCPFAFQVAIRGRHLDMVVYQRSCDLFLGLPFDIAGYALLQRLLANGTGYHSGRLTFMIGDAHIYNNHIEQVQTVLERYPKVPPYLQLDKEATVFNFTPDMAKLDGYEYWPEVRAELNV